MVDVFISVTVTQSTGKALGKGELDPVSVGVALGTGLLASALLVGEGAGVPVGSGADALADAVNSGEVTASVLVGEAEGSGVADAIRSTLVLVVPVADVSAIETKPGPHTGRLRSLDSAWA